uniref:cystine/glutamate transporter-like isoform X3 n=1 Tax=Oncorhynchus gorbuscha TaxID=8017 RepID=UPI001EAEFB91|nr:cystine/glutamate transporter-like isoform X3 [Oncorhynchus gorbuscha]
MGIDGIQLKEEGDEVKEKKEDEVIHLRRTIGLLPAISFIIGTMVGSGIFIAPKGVLMNSGSMGMSLVVWALCGVLSTFAFVVAINCWSVTLASRTQVTLTFIKMFALVLIIVPGIVALARGQTENFQNGFAIDKLTLDKLPLAFYSGLYAYGGWFYLNFVTEEVINPNRNIPLAIIFSMVTLTVCYILVNVAYYTMMTAEELLVSDAVAVTFANRALPGLASAIPVLVAVSCLGALNGGFFGAPRMLFVGAREGHWPVLFSMIHIHRNTPLPAVLLLYPLVVVMVARGEIFQLINFASFSWWLFIAMATMGMLIHRYRFPLHPRPFKVPLAIAVTFTVVCFFIVGLSLYSDPWNTGGSCALTLSGVPVYYLTVHRSHLPTRWRKSFNYCNKQLQILLEVAQQEVQAY